MGYLGQTRFPMKFSFRPALPALSALPVLWLAALTPFAATATNTSVHTTWLWHLHQPIYWPDRAPANHAYDHYQNAWDTIQLGNPHPTDTSLSTVFGVGDRVAAYQAGPKNSLGNLLGYANAGVQVNYSGALMENVQSLAAVGTLGYGGGWNNNFSTAHSWTTSGGKPRMDMVNFTYHHAMAPLLSDETLEMELRINQRQQQIFWGTTSRGYFPTETCFSEHMIPILNKVGIAWSVIGNTHLARTCADFPVATGSGGEMCDLPNPADQLNPAQGAGNYRRLAIDRGCSPIQAAPFGFQLHYARYVDPNTGSASTVIVAPSDQVFGWKDSYSTWDLGLVDFVAARNNTSKPSLVFCAHDGDNAWSGGSSYYNEWVPNMASTAAGKGYEPTTIEQFIADFPPDTGDVVHVEDGGWVFADSDFGSPSFINWNWPPSYATSGGNVVDPSIGQTDKGDNWRVIIATENRVKTAQQISGLTNRVDQVRDPGSYSGTPNAVELGWHYYLAGLDSGFVYYGCTADECLRSIYAQSNAVRNVNSLLSNLSGDATPPTVFLPQRHPWNPGGTNFGVQYGYKTVVAANSDFWVWTYAYDASGITNVSLFVRNNGANPPTSDVFKTYAGGSPAGAWQASAMTQRVATNSSGYTPQYMADYYYTKVTGISNAYCDYYVSATDAHGNTFKSPIQHVYVGAGGGSGGNNSGSSGPVSITPTNPVAGNSVTVQYTATGRALASAASVNLHLGWNNYSVIVSPDLAMTFNAASNWWQCSFTIANTATNFNCTFNNGAGTWDNNGGANWNFTVVSNANPVAPAQPQNVSATPVATNQINLSWSAASGASVYFVNRDSAPIATTAGTSYNDTGLAANSSHCYFVTASNSVGASAASATVCTNTPAVVTNLPAFVLDGAFDSSGYLLASSGMVLYGAVRGTTLYVATWSPGTNGANDHFIFVTDQLLPAATAAAPWAKAGSNAVAATKPFLAGESSGTYVSWFANGGSTNWPCTKSYTNAGAMEGTLDLTAAFGSVPANIYLCAAAYQTADGGVLASQCPAAVTNNGNLEPNEFLMLPVSALKDSAGNGTLDLCDPARGFKINSAVSQQRTNRVLNFAVMPGRSYQIQYSTNLNSGWTNFPATNYAAPPQTLLNFTDAPASGTPQRFYRVKLLP
jgi:Starch/carbohydrate-binding module (family 53)/Glycosyl hydrolase family 57